MKDTDTTPGRGRADHEIPLACVPGAIAPGERAAHFERLTRLFTIAVRAKRELPDGYAYRFDADAFDEIAEWMTRERRCCPFLRFTLELAPDDGPIWVSLTGPAGSHAFLDAEIPASPTAGAS